MKKILIVITFLLYSISLFSQGYTILTETNLTYNNLTASQKVSFDRFVDPEYYSEYKIVQLENILLAQEEGYVKVNLSYLTPELVFKMNYVNYENEASYFYYGQNPYDNEFTNSKLTYQKYNNFTLLNISINDKDYDVYDLGSGLGLFAESNGEYNDAICPNILSPKEANSTYPYIDPCIGAIPKVLIIYNDAVESKYGYSCIATKANMSINQTNAIRMNSSSNLSKLVLAGIENVNISQDNTSDPDLDISLDLNELQNSSTVQQHRNNYIADIVVLYVKKLYKGGGATIWGKVQSFCTNDDIAFTIVNFKEATGERRVFAHEVHHLYDARHHSDNTGVPIAHAHCLSNCANDCDKDNEHTVMWGCGKGKNIDYLSNPARTYITTPTGIAGVSENAIRAEQRDLAVSMFRPDPALALFASIHIDPFPNCELVSYSTVKVKCGTPPYTYQYQQSNDGINWFNTTTVTTNLAQDYQTVALPIPSNNSIYASGMFIVTVTDANNDSYSTNVSVNVWCKGQGQNPPNWHHTFPDPNAPKYNNNNLADNLLVYPNPTSNHISVLLNKEFNELKECTLVNMNFQKIDISINRADNKLDINLPNNLSAGIYILKLTSNVTNEYFKIIVE